MFTLWYSVLSWREYKATILAKLPQCPLSGGAQTPKSTPSRIPVAEPPKTTPAAPKPIPTPPSKSPLPPKLEPPAKPPRSPSPHPLRADAFEDIEYEEEETEEEEEEEEDDEDSVIDSFPAPGSGKAVTNSVNDFINVEIKSQRDQR